MKQIVVALLVLVLGVVSYNLVTVVHKEANELRKELTGVTKKNTLIEKENEEFVKTIAHLETLNTKETDSETDQQGEKSSVVNELDKEKIDNQERIEKINEEFVSESFNFKDSTERSSNMKAYMTDGLKETYTKKDESATLSEFETVKVSGTLKKYQSYVSEAKNDKINLINDVSVQYKSESDQTDYRMMFLVTYDEETLKVEDVQFLPVLTTEEE